jgi:mRNA interferase MazF
MPTFEQGDVVRVPFPYTDRNTCQHRPALVISKEGLGPAKGLLWVAMITAAANRPWPEDWPIEDFAKAGLPIPSVVRPAKITTIEAKNAEVVGRLDPALRLEIIGRIAQMLGPP